MDNDNENTETRQVFHYIREHTEEAKAKLREEYGNKIPSSYTWNPETLAAVWNRMLTFSMKGDNVCRAGSATIAQLEHYDESTVRRAIKTLAVIGLVDFDGIRIASNGHALNVYRMVEPEEQPKTEKSHGRGIGKSHAIESINSDSSRNSISKERESHLTNRDIPLRESILNDSSCVRNARSHVQQDNGPNVQSTYWICSDCGQINQLNRAKCVTKGCFGHRPLDDGSAQTSYASEHGRTVTRDTYHEKPNNSHSEGSSILGQLVRESSYEGLR